MVERLSWKKLARELAFFYLPWTVLGFVFGNMVWFLLVASWVLLLWHYYHQLKMSDWLWKERSLTPPSGSGSWEPLFNGIYRLQIRNRRRRKELATVIRRFRGGAEAMPDALVVFRNEGHIVWCNKLAQHVLGFRWPDDAGQPINNLLRSPDFVRYLTKRQFDNPIEITAPTNPDRTLELRIMPYTDGEYIMVARDVSQVKQLEGMRRNFFANVSHELRTPMTVLQGYLEMTTDPDMMPRPMWDKAHGVMTEQLGRMAGLVNQLLTLSKIEAAPVVELSEVVDVPSILEILEKEAISLSGDKQQQFHFSIEPGLKVFADEDQLRSAISNLVYNAVKHTPAEACIKVNWFSSTKGPRLEVTDSGEGIAPQHIHRLTERFYRVDKARSRETGGSGLGLAIVKHALSHHDSQLEIASQPGEGSTFAFTLPERLIAGALV
ncbi:phosphate regulon sensor histidine kinase PhoR [Thaumasiovibrio sp. DFM-14]|uniref:phosphate regulon sensor histidine kinase PhoR n=1 Tax=Thaumasiovibrio sp. DFM-14 TaxID=3384792 RepID=UPI0039A21416